MSENIPSDSPAPTPDAETPPENPTDDSNSQPDSAKQPDDLPEEFELTPELVEEEAIRGDIMLRWSAVLLAILLGCTQIADSQALVHVKTGQYLASHGVIPDGTDPFSYTTEGRVWRNQAWLFDLILAGVYGIGGTVGLSLFKALMAGATIWCIVGISRPHTPMWWTAIVAVLGSIALIPHLTATPEIVTILGCAVLLRIFSRWRYQEPAKLNWKLAVLFFVWCNADPRMYLGLLLLVLLAIGEAIRRTPREDAPIIPASPLWSTIGVVCVATLLNPFGWHSLGSAWEVHGVLDPAMRTYFPSIVQLEHLGSFPIWSTPFWDQLTVPFICTLVMAGLALSSIYLNFGKWIAGDLLAVLVFGGLAALTYRESGPAIVVMCVVTSLYCQDWYRESFSQEYTVNKGELLFSRGGRALTVISFVVVAWLGMSGRLYRGYLTSIGFGFESSLNVSVAGLQSKLADSYDNKPFNFKISQGNILIWANQRVFIDRRLALYTGSKDSLDDLTQTDLIALHSRTSNAMRYSDDVEQDAKNRTFWKSIFDRFGVTHALPRIAGRNPDYRTYKMLMINPEFELTVLAPSVAVFYRTDLDNKEYQQYLAEHRVNFLELAFGEDVAIEEPVKRQDFPQPESAFVSYLTAGREQAPPPLVLAGHYLQHIQNTSVRDYPIEFLKYQFAFCYLAIRNANQALAENPDSAHAFQLLGEVYFDLGQLEGGFAQTSGVQYDMTFRLMQSHLAFHQSLIGAPDSIPVTIRLMNIAELRQRLEPQLRMARRLKKLLQAPGEQVKDEQQVLEDTQKKIEQLETQLAPVYKRVKEVKGKAEPLALAAQLVAICPYTAQEIMDEHAESIPQNPETELLRGILALETGRAEEAYTKLLRLEPFFSETGAADGYRYATFAALGHADYPNAFDLKQTETELRQTIGAIQLLLSTMPLSAPPPAAPEEYYSISRGQTWDLWTNEVQEQVARNLWQQAVILLEEGQNSQAADVLKRAFDVAPNSSFRPMLYVYLTCVSKERLDPYPPAERIPVTAEMFAEDAEEETEQ